GRGGESLVVKKPLMKDRSTGENKPYPVFTSADSQTDFPNLIEEELKRCQAELKDAQQMISDQKQLLKFEEEAAKQVRSRAENERKSLQQEYERTLSTLTTEKETALTTLSTCQQTISDLQATLATRDRESAETTETTITLRAQIQSLTDDQTQTQSITQNLQQQLCTALSNLSSSLSETTDLKTQHAEMKTKVEHLTAGRDDAVVELAKSMKREEDLRAQLERAESERNECETRMRQAVEVEQKAKERLGGMHASLDEAQKEIERLVGHTLEIERLLRIQTEKARDYETSLSAVMRYPDCSLGHDFSFSDLPPSDEIDKILKDMINSNNIRIALLEQKNNEFRVLRIKQTAAAQHQPPITQRSALYEQRIVDRAKDAVAMHQLDQWTRTPPLTTSKSAPYAAWTMTTDGDGRYGKPIMIPQVQSVTHHPPDELGGFDPTRIAGESHQRRASKEDRQRGKTQSRPSSAGTQPSRPGSRPASASASSRPTSSALVDMGLMGARPPETSKESGEKRSVKWKGSESISAYSRRAWH
ncbi:hypothetical protein HK104_011186, partial [Borealophlyctis nickersoniae]